MTAIPDESRGERLVAFYTRADVPPEVLWAQLSETRLPRLWLPRRDSLVPIEAIPTLGTGKVDLRRLREMAANLSQAGASKLEAPYDPPAGAGFLGNN